MDFLNDTVEAIPPAMNEMESKIWAMAALSIGCIFFGLLPAHLRLQERRRQLLLISNLLCFGAGVLLATSLIHMLPEVRQKLPEYAELILCCGFFLVYIVDEIVHAAFGETFRHEHRDHQSTANHQRMGRPYYGSTSETRGLLDDPNQTLTQSTVIRQTEDAGDEEANARICHTTHTEPCEQSSAGHAGLLMALTIHAVLEGLAIGVQDSASKVFVLLGAVCCHKFVVGFCLGVELSSTPGATYRNLLIAILTFGFGSVVGIALGMGLTDLKEINDGSALLILQGIAAGTLLYVTVCEVLPREKARWHMSRKRYAGILQCLSVICGFSAMTVLTFFYVA